MDDTLSDERPRLTARPDEGRGVEQMQIAITGLGRIGAGMARRLARDGHEVVAWNRTEAVAVALAAEPENGGHVTVVGARSEALAARMSAPRHVVISVPSGDATSGMVEHLAAVLSPGDVIVDAGNSNFHDSQQRAADLATHGLEFLDMGVSGGIWGLQVGFCAMVGGKREVFDAFEPAVRDRSPRKDGYLYCGPAGAGPLREDGPQRDRVRPDAGLRRGLRHPPCLGVPARPRGRGSPLEQRIGDPLLAPRAGRGRLRAGGQRPGRDPRLGGRLRRGALDGGRGDRRTTCPPRSSPSPCSSASAAGAIPTASPTASWRRSATSSAGTP